MTYNEIIKKYVPKDVIAEQNTNLIIFEVMRDQLVHICKELYTTHKLPLKTIKATDERKENGSCKIFYVFGVPKQDFFLVPYLTLKNTTDFPSLVSHIYEVSLYEREMNTLFGLTPIGHPDLRKFLLHENWPGDVHPLRKDVKWDTRPKTADESYEFQQVSGEGIYEIPVGPVHAGIIEPGHFRFSVAGEEILQLEPKLGYVHKGSEKLFEVLPMAEKIKLAESISGDTSYSHSLAFCQAVETVSSIEISERATYLRVIFSELERLANHFNDFGFILNDTAFAFGGSNGTRLREHIMQLCDQMTGHRFLRGVNVIGGVTKDISEEMQVVLKNELLNMQKDFEEVVAIAGDNETVLNRLKGTGVLKKQIALDHGVVGVAARATGILTDARVHYPYAAYRTLPVHVVLQQSGDVYARYNIRIEEIFVSINLIIYTLEKLKKKEEIIVPQKPLAKNAYAIGITEGWRGDIVYFVATDKNGAISRVGVRDASFLNWPVVPYTVLGNIVPDFPLINKSFNLSYSGFDR